MRPGLQGLQRSTSDGGDDSFGLYVHYPLCRRRCGYCDFPVVEMPDFPHGAYSHRILQEVRRRAEDYRRWRLASVYFGGGTPSLWPIEEIERIVDGIAAEFRAGEAVEVTLEANPGTLSFENLHALRRVGVNRISLGIQSLDDDMLRRLTRDHDAAEARRAVSMVRRAGFENLNCDLMFGLRGQTSAQYLADVDAVLRLAPDHVSMYALTLSKGSALRRAGAAVADDDTVSDMLHAGRDALESAGLCQYEVSNYAPRAARSAHNCLVWGGQPYLGVGAAAHSLLLDGSAPASADRGGVRHVRVINPPFSRYLAADWHEGWPPCLAPARVRQLTDATARFEAMMLGLRTMDGVHRGRYQRRFGADPMQHFGSGLRELERLDLVVITSEQIAPTRQSIWFADELALRI